MTIKRILLARRRIDAVLLAAGFALVGFGDIVTKLVFMFFILAGFYLACLRRRNLRFAPPVFTLALFSFGLWPILLGLGRGEPIEDNRQLVYSLIAVGFVFFPIGINLVRRPLAAAVSGARLGTITLTILALADFGWNGDRVGLWGNEALFAFLVAFSAILGRIDVRPLPAFMPNGMLCFYLSIVPAILSQTRAAWFAYLIAALLDAPKLVVGWRHKARPSNVRLLAAAVGVACLAIVPGARIVSAGFENGMAQFTTYSRQQAADTSVGIRMSMWHGAIEVLVENPVLGVGATRRVDAVAEKMPESRSVLLGFKHLHNLFLDEALSNGGVGLVLMLTVFLTFVVAVARRTADVTIQQTAGLIVLLIVSFGQFHGVMLNETTLMAIYAAFMAILAGIAHEPRGRGATQGL